MATTPESVQAPNPAVIFDNMSAYQRTAALKAAIELDVFTAIASGNHTADAIAQATKASLRGIRILCDYLVVHGFLSKQGDQYSLTADSAAFLNRNSPAYLGGTIHFILDPRLLSPFLDLTRIVREGRTTLADEGTVSQDNPIWVDFARHMAPMVYPAAMEIADLVAGDGAKRVLDIAAGHGLFGITIAQRNSEARITAVDWPNVLSVATENAKKAGVAARHATIPGDAFDVDFKGPYDLVLVTNFFHHYEPQTCEKLMRKILAALAPGGQCVTLDFMPNEDRVSPPTPASFGMMMLGTTQSGDVYTFSEYETMFRNAGFASSNFHLLTKSPEAVVVSTKA
jgi:2-polyprenyl-3-methyl-5-hydroxy-6-metoxy-1,4-benzoquinol methylase